MIESAKAPSTQGGMKVMLRKDRNSRNDSAPKEGFGYAKEGFEQFNLNFPGKGKILFNERLNIPPNIKKNIVQ